MCTELRPSGIAPVGPVSWGSHFCQFYRTREDLLEALVPYFAAGLAANEQCLWVTGDSVDPAIAAAAMRAAVPDLERRLASGQMEFVDGDAWYATRRFDAERTLAAWVKRESPGCYRLYDADLPDYARIGGVLRLPAPLSIAAGLLTANGRPRREGVLAHYAEAIAARRALGPDAALIAASPTTNCTSRPQEIPA